tara:strand:- start:869 stop:1756 length:888 start_codon:yes stop_codon:yes gene_type:complete
LRDLGVHEAIMVEQVIKNLVADKKGNYVDCTFGLGGHSIEILKQLDSDAKLTGIDRDPESLLKANKVLRKDKRFSFINDKFGNIQNHFDPKSLDGILVDLGISSDQLESPERGFSFQLKGPLDMRMSQSDKVSAETWINKSTKEEIAKVLWEIGEERHSRKISESICRERDISPINTTQRLSEIIIASKPRRSKKHPATNIFRAIRMEINSEIQELQNLLISAGKLLKEGGRLAVISFHSLEDRIVKRFVQGKSLEGQNYSFKKVGPKHFKPNQEEVSKNPRSRSAILRIVEKVA